MTANDSPDSVLLTPAQAAEILGGVHEMTVRRKAWAGELECVKVGKRLFFTRPAIDDYIARVTRPAVVRPRTRAKRSA